MKVFGQKANAGFSLGQMRVASALKWTGMQPKHGSEQPATEASFPTKPLSELCKPSRNKYFRTRLG